MSFGLLGKKEERERERERGGVEGGGGVSEIEKERVSEKVKEKRVCEKDRERW